MLVLFGFNTDMTRERLERAFYQFFSETRMFPGKPFFHPVDAQNRPMIPLYHALLSQLTTSDIRSIRRFYLQHGITALAAREWVEAQHQLLGGPGAAVELTPEEKKQLSEQRLLSTAAHFHHGVRNGHYLTENYFVHTAHGFFAYVTRHVVPCTVIGYCL